jgi:monomeric isocitrate dehydrogenase
MKFQSLQQAKKCAKEFGKFWLFQLQKWSKMAKIVISYRFTGNFFQNENTKCTIFEQNRLIACQTQEKNQKMYWFGKL